MIYNKSNTCILVLMSILNVWNNVNKYINIKSIQFHTRFVETNLKTYHNSIYGYHCFTELYIYMFHSTFYMWVGGWIYKTYTKH